MRKTTITIPAIYMTKEEEHDLWPKGREEWLKHGIEDWYTDDGCNEVRLKDENFYRVVTHTYKN